MLEWRDQQSENCEDKRYNLRGPINNCVRFDTLLTIETDGFTSIQKLRISDEIQWFTTFVNSSVVSVGRVFLIESERSSFRQSED
jgi:hypothetical protein